MERLNLNYIADIVYRLRQGQSERAITIDTDHSRHTIRRYHALAREKGYLDLQRDLPQPEELLRELGPLASPPAMVSSVQPYETVVQDLLKAKVEMQTIFRRLVQGHGYRGSYSSLKRFVHRLQPPVTEVCFRMETPPGREAQVDFGGVPAVRDRRTGRQRSTYCFTMTLSHSRHQYSELVFDQKMETWIQCHQHAFEFFGGVPAEIVIDNLKAAVLKVHLHDPILSTPYTRLAQHYGLLVHPCRVRTPQHKGKVENGIHYVQRSFMAGREFLDLEDANHHLREWVLEEAGLRQHGTTHEAPLHRFHQAEAGALQPLPVTPFALVRVTQGLVGRDTFVTLDGSYYQAPHQWVGHQLEVHVYQRTVQLYQGVTLLVTYERASRPGLRLTREDFYPPHRALYLIQSRDACPALAAQVGPGCATLVQLLLEDRPVDKLRSVQGVLRLGEQHTRARLERACTRALHYGDPSYRCVKKILEAGLDQEELPVLLPPSRQPVYQHSRSAEEFFGELAASGLTPAEVPSC